MAVADEYPINLDVRLGKARLQLFPVQPVRGRSATIEETRFSQNERSDTNRGNAASFLLTALQELHNTFRRLAGIERRADEQGIEWNLISPLRVRRHAERVDDQAAVD